MADAAGEPLPPPFDFSDPTRLTRWVEALLYLELVMSVVGLIGGALELQVLNAAVRGSADAELSAQSDRRQALIGLLQFITFLAAGSAILMWIHRANFNVRQLGARYLRYTPGWSVGWYFIPFLNLWKPYGAMREIWRASAHPAPDWQTQPNPSGTLLPVWWTLWLLSNSFANASFRLTLAAEAPRQYVAATLVGQIADALQIPLCLVLLVIVKRVHSMQMQALQARRVPIVQPALV